MRDRFDGRGIEWQERVETARRALFQHPHYDLDYTHTMRLFAMFGPELVIDRYQKLEEWKWQEQDPLALLGWQRRAWNSILCVERIVDFCRPLNLPVDYRDALNQAKSLVLQKTPREVNSTVLPIESDKLAYQHAGLRKTSKEISQALTAYICIEEMFFVVGWDVNNDFNPEESYMLDEEELVELREQPLATLVASAVGGYYFSPTPVFVDDVARLNFWLWWLDESLPASWNLEEL